METQRRNIVKLEIITEKLIHTKEGKSFWRGGRRAHPLQCNLDCKTSAMTKKLRKDRDDDDDDGNNWKDYDDNEDDENN